MKPFIKNGLVLICHMSYVTHCERVEIAPSVYYVRDLNHVWMHALIAETYRHDSRLYVVAIYLYRKLLANLAKRDAAAPYQFEDDVIRWISLLSATVYIQYSSTVSLDARTNTVT